MYLHSGSCCYISNFNSNHQFLSQINSAQKVFKAIFAFITRYFSLFSPNAFLFLNCQSLTALIEDDIYAFACRFIAVFVNCMMVPFIEAYALIFSKINITLNNK